MKIFCDQQKLSDAVSNVIRCVSTKSSIAALEGILLRTVSGGLELTGYDMDMAMKTTIDARVDMGGEIVLSARLFADIIRRLPGETVDIEVDDRLTTVISSGETNFSLMGISALEFPELPAVKNTVEVELEGKVLYSMIHQTRFAVAVSDAKPIHTGILFELRPGRLRLVSVDGYRMAIRTEPIRTEETGSFVVPGKTLGEVEKLIGEAEDNITFAVSKRHIMFQIGDYTVFSRLLDGEFLEYEASIPQDSNTSIVMNTRRFYECIERVSLVISDRIKNAIRCKFTEHTAFFSCVTALGKAKDQMEVSLHGEEVEMGFNNRYLMDALKACEEAEVRIVIKGPVSPMKIMPCEGDAFLYLVLPMRLKAEVEAAGAE